MAGKLAKLTKKLQQLLSQRSELFFFVFCKFYIFRYSYGFFYYIPNTGSHWVSHSNLTGVTAANLEISLMGSHFYKFGNILNRDINHRATVSTTPWLCHGLASVHTGTQGADSNLIPLICWSGRLAQTRLIHSLSLVVVRLFVSQWYKTGPPLNGECHLAIITGATILVSWHEVKSLKPIWRSGNKILGSLNFKWVAVLT